MIISFTSTALCGQDLRLWYTEPAAEWTEALPIGNGKLGAMVFGGIEQDRIQFNEESLWTGTPRDYNKKGAHQYLQKIRSLLFEGKQAAAEKLAGEHFMGTKSIADERKPWFDGIRRIVDKKRNPSLKDFNDKEWKLLTLPLKDGWEKEGLEGLDGAVWFRTDFELPTSWRGRDLVVDLGKIRDQDFTYVNGQLIGTTQDMNQGRLYVIPKELVEKQNQLAIQVLNYEDKGGPVGYKDPKRRLRIYPKDGDETNYVSLNKMWKYWVQDDHAPRVGKYQEAYQPFGDLLLDFNHSLPVEDYKRTLDLTDAICETSYSSGRVQYKRTYFVSAIDQSLAVHLTASVKERINFRATLSTPHKTYQLKKVNDSTISLSLQVKHGALEGVSLLKVRHNGGSIIVDNNQISVVGADTATIFLTAATNFINHQDISAKPHDISRDRINQLANKTYEHIREVHVQDYQGYFNRFSLNFGTTKAFHLPTDKRIEQFATVNDPNLVALFAQYARYLLITSSREGGQPPNLQGIWNDLLTPPWGSKYTTNINAEMNYWPAELMNLSDLHKPLFDLVQDLSETGKKTAKEYYDAPGWVLHHNTDLWRGTAPINNANHGIWVTGGAWLCQHLWEHYCYTQDKHFLQNKAYPIMKDAAVFFDYFLVEDPNTGLLISTPSNSPEHGGLVAGPTMDHQIIRQLFKNVIEASKILDVDTAFASKIASKSKKIAPNTIGKHGQLQEWLSDIDDPNNTHRHVSHLWAVYPGSEINWKQTPELMEAAKQSLLFRGDEGTGWSLAWKINLWTRFLDAEHADRLLNMLISPAVRGGGVYPNLFDAHPPFQIDGNFGGASGIGEMLLQSHLEGIDLLPALPSSLHDGEVKGICARGGFELSFSWKSGSLEELEVVSKAGGLCRIRYKGKEFSFQTVKDGKYKLDGQLKLLTAS
ncbi:glycoside hydrolase N-terminal domain-containing protein [Olivibacter sp. SDN3]|uniref:glycoside hydrolase family 95 protein n=1 Tax=Olivibacter sp. SDN3 TaxID=2764720 RepID=UPI0021024931|nr:glycoside hydrolase N-terminal domain-containing protein [Olivibacter sp. SDN3]